MGGSKEPPAARAMAAGIGSPQAPLHAGSARASVRRGTWTPGYQGWSGAPRSAADVSAADRRWPDGRSHTS